MSEQHKTKEQLASEFALKYSRQSTLMEGCLYTGFLAGFDVACEMAEKRIALYRSTDKYVDLLYHHEAHSALVNAESLIRSIRTTTNSTCSHLRSFEILFEDGYGFECPDCGKKGRIK